MPTFKSPKDFATFIKKNIATLETKESMKILAELAAELIRKRTRLGYGVETLGAARKKLKPLDEDYVKIRKRKGVSNQTTSKKSNLTSTGQLLDSISITKLSGKQASVGPTGSREGGALTKDGDALTNSELAEFVTEAGRPFNNLSNNELKQLQQMAVKIIEEALKKSGA